MHITFIDYFLRLNAKKTSKIMHRETKVKDMLSTSLKF